MSPDRDLEEYVDYYLSLRPGKRQEAFFGLIDGPKAIRPLLMKNFHESNDPETRRFLVEVLWQHNREDRETLEFLASAIRDPEGKVWKEGLNGLVAAGSKSALSRLEAAKQEFLKSPNHRDRMEWLEEAIGELKEGPIA